MGVFAMSDATGMFQHAIGTIPDRRHGYCIDDNARALMWVNVAEGIERGERIVRAGQYASFIQHAWNPDRGAFRNFMETFPFFAAAVLAVVVTERTGGESALGAQVYFWARLAYLPIYAAGSPYVRSLAWAVSLWGLLQVLWVLF